LFFLINNLSYPNFSCFWDFKKLKLATKKQ